MEIPMDKVVATVALTVVLGISGLGFIVWMAAIGWADLHGLIVGIIFVVCSILQGLFSFGWWQRLKNFNEYRVPDQEMVMMNSKKSMEAKAT